MEFVLICFFYLEVFNIGLPQFVVLQVFTRKTQEFLIQKNRSHIPIFHTLLATVKHKLTI